MEKFEGQQMYILPDVTVKDFEAASIMNMNNPSTVIGSNHQMFTCYVCNEISPWINVSSRNMRPFLEGQTYMCCKCDGKSSLTNETNMITNDNIESQALNEAIIKSVTAHGISFSVCHSSNEEDSPIIDQNHDHGEISDQNEEENYEERRYLCSLCDKRFKRNGHLQRHMRTHTVTDPIFKCDKCQKCYRDSDNLLRHKKTHQTDAEFNDKPYTCGICEKKFRDNFDLQRHVRIHTGEEPYKCIICDRGFIDNRTLRKHIKQHKGEKNCICPICQKGFIENRALNKHIKTYKGEMHYKCDICDKTFSKDSSLLFHTKMHTEKLEHKCELCGESFRSNNNYELHKKIHDEEITSFVSMSTDT